ncbi:MAG: PhoX family phosphatase [Bdellovibrionales bacterium]
MHKNRRDFLQFMGRTLAASTLISTLPACRTATKVVGPPMPFTPLLPTRADDLKLAEGFRYQIVLKWGQKLNSKGDTFGFNNDYIAYRPLSNESPDEGLMWVNHEYHDPYYVSGWRPGQPRTVAQFNIERKSMGGTIAHIYKVDGRWQLKEDSPYNRRIDGTTPIPFVTERPIMGHRKSMGMLGNCAGGVTPWGTILTCEENYQNFVGEAVIKDGKRVIEVWDKYLDWTSGLKLPPEHYGWVVEVDLKTGKAKKHTALGRFCHECATCVVAPDGRTVVYSGDDTENEHLYKFISRKAGSLDEGELYVADTINGHWLPISRAKDARLKKEFPNHTEMMIQTRKAAKIVGATPLDRPEDIEIDPVSKNIFVALTNNPDKGNSFGSIMRLMEADNNPLSMEFKTETFLAGGPETGFACPDNMVFDRKGNLWMTNDMSGKVMFKGEYQNFGCNGLFFIPLSGPHAGRAMQVASSPRGAEMTGPCFSADGQTLFVSIQHPGERAHLREDMVSHWPDGGDSVPSPAVVAISGPALQGIVG